MQTALSPVTNHFTQVLPDHRTSNGVLFLLFQSSNIFKSKFHSEDFCYFKPYSAFRSDWKLYSLILFIGDSDPVSEKAKPPWKDSNKKKSFSSTFVPPLPAAPNGPESMSVGSRLCQFLLHISKFHNESSTKLC